MEDKEQPNERTWGDVCKQIEAEKGKGSHDLVFLRDGTRVWKVMADIIMWRLEMFAQQCPHSFQEAYLAAKVGEPLADRLAEGWFEPGQLELVRDMMLNGVRDTPEGPVVGSPYPRDEQGRLPKRDLTRLLRQWTDRTQEGGPTEEGRGPQR